MDTVSQKRTELESYVEYYSRFVGFVSNDSLAYLALSFHKHFNRNINISSVFVLCSFQILRFNLVIK